MQTKTNWNELVSGKDLATEKKYRTSQYEEKTCHIAAVTDPENAGWEHFWTSKNGKRAKIRKEKAVGDLFEDRVWTMFAKLGFTTLNKGRNFVIRDGVGRHQQIDVFAVDKDSVIIVECKAASERKVGNFKKPIEAFAGQKEWISKVVREQYPDRKVVFIWAVSNFFMSNPDKERIAAEKIVLFEEETVAYFTDLVGHLGACAKYQLNAKLYANTSILGEFDNKVVAIKSKLGQYDCYSFSIDPERLLKISYILHHHPTNENMMPTYQRLIKKPRLVQIRRFIEEEHGYFANSLIISIDSKGKALKFDKVPTPISDKISQVGVLHLPSEYCSAYVIDGQHRLYAYSGSDLAKTQRVPVVAFVNLQNHEQLKLFMEINENQKSVPKSLRVTLNADMLWDSPNPRESRQAIASKLAQRLEEDKKSKLYGRIIVGENETSKYRRVTVLAIQDALSKSGLLDVYARNGDKPTTIGLLDYNNSGKTFSRVYEVIDLVFSAIYDACPSVWEMTDDDGTILVTNRGIQAIIRIIGDVLRILVEKKYIQDPKTLPAEDIAESIFYYMTPLCDYFVSATEEQRKALRSKLGGGADTKFWREFQRIIHEKYPQFDPPGLLEYLRDETKQFNETTKLCIDKIHEAVWSVVFDNYLAKFESDDERLKEFPKAIYKRITKQKSDLEYDNKSFVFRLKDYVTNSDLRELALIPHLWTEIFEELLSPPWIRKGGAKKIKTQWLAELDELQNKMQNKGFSVSSKDAENVQKIFDWFVGGD